MVLSHASPHHAASHGPPHTHNTHIHGCYCTSQHTICKSMHAHVCPWRRLWWLLHASPSPCGQPWGSGITSGMRNGAARDVWGAPSLHLLRQQLSKAQRATKAGESGPWDQDHDHLGVHCGGTPSFAIEWCQRRLMLGPLHVSAQHCTQPPLTPFHGALKHLMPPH